MAVGQRTTLHGSCIELLARALRVSAPGLRRRAPTLRGLSRRVTCAHSLADIGKARTLLGYEPTHDVRAGLREAVGWYIDHLAN